MDKIRVALLGVSHSHAAGFYNGFVKEPDVEIIGYADVPPYDDQEPMAKAQKNLGKAGFEALTRYEDYKELLAQ